MDYNKESANYIHDRLIKCGFTEAGAAGTMANIYAESGFVSNNLQNSYGKKLGMSDAEYTKAVDDGRYGNFVHDGAGYGLCQWTYWSRKEALLNYAKSRKTSISDMDMQIDYMLVEISGKKSLNNLLRSSNNPAECARAVMLQYEKPKNQSESNIQTREKYAVELHNEFTLEKNKKEKTIKIVIDAGHGINTAGKRCLKSIDPKETREWVLNDRIADKLEEKLMSYNCIAMRADDTTGAEDVPLANRVKMANAAKADVYISIHHNAGINGKNGGGTVVYYCSDDQKREKQAQSLYNSVVGKTGLVGNRARKVINNGFYVIKNTTMPAFLIENGFMDSTTDTPIILTEEHAKKTVDGILEFLIKEFSLIPKDGTEGNNTSTSAREPKLDTKSTLIVKVLVDDLDILNEPNMSGLVKGVTGKGVFTITEVKNGWGKLKSGAGWIYIDNPAYCKIL